MTRRRAYISGSYGQYLILDGQIINLVQSNDDVVRDIREAVNASPDSAALITALRDLEMPEKPNVIDLYLAEQA